MHLTMKLSVRWKRLTVEVTGRITVTLMQNLQRCLRYVCFPRLFFSGQHYCKSAVSDSYAFVIKYVYRKKRAHRGYFREHGRKAVQTPLFGGIHVLHRGLLINSKSSFVTSGEVKILLRIQWCWINGCNWIIVSSCTRDLLFSSLLCPKFPLWLVS